MRPSAAPTFSPTLSPSVDSEASQDVGKAWGIAGVLLLGAVVLLLAWYIIKSDRMPLINDLEEEGPVEFAPIYRPPVVTESSEVSRFDTWEGANKMDAQSGQDDNLLGFMRERRSRARERAEARRPEIDRMAL